MTSIIFDLQFFLVSFFEEIFSKKITIVLSLALCAVFLLLIISLRNRKKLNKRNNQYDD